MAIEITKFRSYSKNTLSGFFSCKLTGIGLEIRDCTLHKKDGRQWIGLPSKPYQDEDGNQKWAYIVKFYDKERWEAFQKATLGALDKYIKEHGPEDKPENNQDDDSDIPF